MTTETRGASYEECRDAYENALDGMSHEGMKQSALYLFQLAWERGDERLAAVTRANAAIARAEAARKLYDASTPGMMLGDVLDALETFRGEWESLTHPAPSSDEGGAA